ncbi:MAG: type II secretion system F family protein [Lachnospiraceae bacterium]
MPREEITIGMPLSRPLQESGLFPPMVYQMIRIGEEAGNTEEMLDKIADYYDEEVEMSEIQSLMAAMEPMIIIVLASRGRWIDRSMYDAYGVYVYGTG